MSQGLMSTTRPPAFKRTVTACQYLESHTKSMSLCLGTGYVYKAISSVQTPWQLCTMRAHHFLSELRMGARRTLVILHRYVFV